MLVLVGFFVSCALLGAPGPVAAGSSLFGKKCGAIPCPWYYYPVCGSDGVTYRNLCSLFVANCKRGNSGNQITVAYWGKCKADPCDKYRYCIEIFRPVCGSDGITYSNECYLQRANCQRPVGTPVISLASQGQCQAVSRCDQIPCTKIYAPVCGSDAKTYANECVMGVASCRKEENNEPPITKAYDGRCVQTTTQATTTLKIDCDSILCIQVYAPVCGTDGKTYSNTCVLGVENCKRKNNNLAPIGEAHSGECVVTTTPPPAVNCDRLVCPAVFAPVCGSDGQTYSNTCQLGVANCRRRVNGQPDIKELYSGQCTTNCENIFCAQISAPVCGSDGVTYPNACELSVASCKQPGDGITQQSEGPCP